jgi:hypothetical protein
MQIAQTIINTTECLFASLKSSNLIIPVGSINLNSDSNPVVIIDSMKWNHFTMGDNTYLAVYLVFNSSANLVPASKLISAMTTWPLKV